MKESLLKRLERYLSKLKSRREMLLREEEEHCTHKNYEKAREAVIKRLELSRIISDTEYMIENA